eukprot:7707596-Pyramimonas_sp.AAC.1
MLPPEGLSPTQKLFTSIPKGPTPDGRLHLHEVPGPLNRFAVGAPISVVHEFCRLQEYPSYLL